MISQYHCIHFTGGKSEVCGCSFVTFMASIVILFMYIYFTLYVCVIYTYFTFFTFPSSFLIPDSSVRQERQTDSLSAQDRALIEQRPCVSG